jgi:hypothetical protein
MIGGLVTFWQSHGEGLERGAEDLYDDVDALGTLVEKILPVRMLGHWAVPIVDIAENPAFKGLDYVFTPLGVYGDAKGLRTTFDQTAGENGLGRAVTMLGVGGTDAAMFWAPAGVANALDLGALNASGQGLALILGGAASGGLKGALQGDDQFADNAGDGQYGWFVKEMAKGEDDVIEHPGDVVHAVVQGDEDAVKDVAHVGVGAVKVVAHVDEDASKDVYHGATHLLSDL